MIVEEMKYSYSQLLAGEPIDVFDLPKMNITDSHASQGFSKKLNLCAFFMTNSYGIAKISVESEWSTSYDKASFDWLVATSIQLRSDYFLISSIPDAPELKIPLKPGIYRVFFGRKVVLSEVEVEDDELPVERVTIFLNASERIEPSQVLVSPPGSQVPNPLLEDS